ncbi:methyl-accepting chemotaxis protein [Bacillus sp. KH172YL63]|uniref:methyl-accepting chemotaxis protein n=1 Tax=Bacillus sp. KH172YL63 TaxID=2709784 RepID=UPI0013E4CAD0|nr:methyl-accepting chemotaxis protein [Bacillus sp. KH172YL63]BCB05714.1 hypothetical protein KH172YL63_38470 [Bacillus sp. KH172YL63]
MKGNNVTLRKQFLLRVLSILVVIAVISGFTQLYFMKKQIVNQTNEQAEAVANTVKRGLEQTELATETIEHQIDLKLVAHMKHIATQLKEKSADEITKEELIDIRDQLGLSGISIFKEAPSKDDYIAVQSTEEQEIGFSFKKFGYYEAGKRLVSGEVPEVPGATFTDQYTLVLPIAQAGSGIEQSGFYKFAYYHVEGTDFTINPFIEANEVYEYMKNVGPETEIKQLVKESDIVEEIGVLNPKVFADPSLEKQIYPPVKKIEAGTFRYGTPKDEEMVADSNPVTISYIEKVKGEKRYKMFIPIDDNRTIYLSLDYEKMSGPLYRHSIILIISGLASLIVLFLLTARFFNRIYENLQHIKNQITSLEEGDLTVKSDIKDGSELELLSQSTNRMVDKLNQLVAETHKQATKAQRLSILLEAEASDSVEKMYTLSTEATIKAREQLNEFTAFLEDITESMKGYPETGSSEKILSRVEALKEIAHERTAATTDTTITLSDLIQSLHGQARELSDISNRLIKYMEKFTL